MAKRKRRAQGQANETPATRPQAVRVSAIGVEPAGYTPSGRPIRKLRHWRQHFDAHARFVFRRRVEWDESTVFAAGDEVPKDLVSAVKLRRFWDSEIIELMDFEERNVLTGRVERSEPAQATG